MTTKTDDYRELRSRLRSAHLLGTVVSRTECEIEAADAIDALIKQRDDAHEHASDYEKMLESLQTERDTLTRENERLREAGRKLVANVAGLEKMFDTKEEAAEFSELWRDFVKVLNAPTPKVAT